MDSHGPNQGLADAAVDPTDARRFSLARDWMERGASGSLLLHVALLGLIFCRLPWPAPVETRIVPIDLVRLADKSVAGGNATVGTPQQRATELAEVPAPEAVPVPGTAPPQADPRPGPPRSAPDVLAVVTPDDRRSVPKAVKHAPPAPNSSARLQRAPSPDEDLAAQLKMLSHLTQPAPPVPSKPSTQDGEGVSNVTAGAGSGAATRRVAYNVKDLIRAQVERRWHVNRSQMKVPDWTVNIHIRLEPDGTVDLAEIVNDARYGADKDYQDFARSARNAVFTSSPLVLPPAGYALARDIVVDFNPQRVSE